MRKPIAVCMTLVMLCMFFMCGCGEQSSAEIKYADMQTLAADMAAADSTLPEMLTVTDADENADISFSSVSDMEYDKIAHYCLVYSAEGKADEICVIAVKDPANVQEAKAALEAHAAARVRMYREYDASQAPRAENAVIFTDGVYAVLVICDHPDAVKAAFTAGIA